MDEHTSGTEAVGTALLPETGTSQEPDVTTCSLSIMVTTTAVSLKVAGYFSINGTEHYFSINVRSPELAKKIGEELLLSRDEISRQMLRGEKWQTRYLDEVKQERVEKPPRGAVIPIEFARQLEQDRHDVKKHIDEFRARIPRVRRPSVSQQHKPLILPWSTRMRKLKGLPLSERLIEFNRCRPPEHERGERELNITDSRVVKPHICKASGATGWPWNVFHFVASDSAAVHELRISCKSKESAVVWRNEQASVIKGIVDEILWRNASEIWRAIQIGQETLCSRMTICDEWNTLAGFVNHFGIWNFVDKTAIFIIDSGIGLHPGNCRLGRSDSKVKRRFLDDCEQLLRYEKLGLCSLEDVDSLSRIDADPDIVVAAMKTLETRTKSLSQSERKKQFDRLLKSLVEEYGSIGPDELATRFSIRGGMQRIKLELHGKAMNQPETYLEQLESLKGPSKDELRAMEDEPVDEQAEEELTVA